MTFPYDRQRFDAGTIGLLLKRLKDSQRNHIFTVTVTKAEQTHGREGVLD
jgi:hypothetical protein